MRCLICDRIRKVSEGVWTCRAIHGAAAESGVDMPITEKLYSILFEGACPRDGKSEEGVLGYESSVAPLF